MSETVLKGGIAYYNYIWRTEEGACEKCQALNGLTFKNTDEIPDRPHPNCRCWVEVINENDSNDYDNEILKDDELCDCNEQYLDNLIFKLEEGKGDAQSLTDDYKELESKLINSQKHFEEIIQSYKNMLQEVENEITQHFNTCKNHWHYFKDFIDKKIEELSLKPKNIKDLFELIIVSCKVIAFLLTNLII